MPFGSRAFQAARIAIDGVTIIEQVSNGKIQTNTGTYASNTVASGSIAASGASESNLINYTAPSGSDFNNTYLIYRMTVYIRIASISGGSVSASATFTDENDAAATQSVLASQTATGWYTGSVTFLTHNGASINPVTLSTTAASTISYDTIAVLEQLYNGTFPTLPTPPTPPSCFVAGTMVLMADGTLKPIEQVQAGDEVLGVVEHTYIADGFVVHNKPT